MFPHRWKRNYRFWNLQQILINLLFDLLFTAIGTRYFEFIIVFDDATTAKYLIHFPYSHYYDDQSDLSLLIAQLMIWSIGYYNFLDPHLLLWFTLTTNIKNAF